jgi:steroid Delta-isomerase
MNHDAALDAVVRFYESLTPATLPQLRHLYAEGALFKDPFNDVRGQDAIEKIFVHMFGQLAHPRFIVTTRVAQGSDAFLVWDMTFQLRSKPGEPYSIRGASHLVFTHEGKVSYHRDYWDAAEELYEKLPLLGVLMRWLKKVMQSH